MLLNSEIFTDGSNESLEIIFYHVLPYLLNSLRAQPIGLLGRNESGLNFLQLHPRGTASAFHMDVDGDHFLIQYII